MEVFTDAYRILRVKPEDSDQDIKKSWLNLLKEADTNNVKDGASVNPGLIPDINAAYTKLKSPEARTQYDKDLRDHQQRTKLSPLSPPSSPSPGPPPSPKKSRGISVKNWPGYNRAGMEHCTLVLLTMVAVTVLFVFPTVISLVGSNQNLPPRSYAIVFILVDIQGIILLRLTPADLVAKISASVSSVSGFGVWSVVGYNTARGTIHFSLSGSTAFQAMLAVLLLSSLVWALKVQAAFAGRNTI